MPVYNNQKTEKLWIIR